MTIWATGTGESPLRHAIRPVKGQVSRLAGSMPQLQRPLVHQGYSVPCGDALITGATFEKAQLDRLEPTSSGHAHNRRLLQAACPALALGDTLAGRVSLRPTTRDHMPIVGVDHHGRQAFTLGHGARGLTSVWLAAWTLADQLGACRRPRFIRLQRQHRMDRV